MKKFRNPYVSVFLAFLLLFISCQPQEIANLDNTDNGKSTNQELSIKNIVANHIDIVNKFIDDPSQYSNVSDSMIEELRNYVDYDNLLAESIENNIENPTEFANMYLHLQSNMNYLLTNYDFGSASQKEIETIIYNEVNKQFEEEAQAKHLSCGDRLYIAQRRCEQNFTASIALTTVASFWSFGIGTAIAAIGAGLILLNCGANAMSDFRECLAHSQ